MTNKKLIFGICVQLMIASTTGFLYEDALVESNQCAWDAECAAFGDPNVMSMDGLTKMVSCADDSVLSLLMAYGFEVDVKCAGAVADPNRGWIKEIDIKQDDSIAYHHDAVECEALEASSSYLKHKNRWDKVIETYSLFNAALSRELIVTISCRKRSQIEMQGNGGKQNTVFSVHFKLRRYGEFDPSTPENFLATAVSEGVTGKCLPYTDIDPEVFKVKENKESYREEVCKKVGLPFNTGECNMQVDNYLSDCLDCYPDKPNVQEYPDCHYCIRSTQADNSCTENAECCSNSCVDGQCQTETSFEQIPPACCNSTKTCYKKDQANSVNDGYCRACFVANEQCDADRPCCSGLKCGAGGTCIPEQEIETCDCEASCKAVADPVVRSFAWYSKDIPGTHQVLFNDPLFNNSQGLEISYDALTRPKGQGTWITKVFINGDLFFSTSDCPVYTESQLPKCGRRKCLQKRDKPEAGQISFLESAQVQLNGIWPFTKTNDLALEIHCVSKLAIDTGIPDHEFTRLDVFINKQNAFQKPTSAAATEQNAFMIEMLDKGVTGQCVEPFASNTAAINSLGDKKIDKWIKSPQIQTGECTCTSTNDDI